MTTLAYTLRVVGINTVVSAFGFAVASAALVRTLPEASAGLGLSGLLLGGLGTLFHRLGSF